ncbi:MAG: hypothetical protein RPU51_09125 [Candidatus Sedimenticola sp. (ex Thyasira tokunagai)]
MAIEVASIWSAIAATFSAVAAISILRIQHNNMLDAARPEIILDGWSRKTRKIGENEIDVITFSKVINAGNGSALHVHINKDDLILEDRPEWMLSTKMIPIVSSNEKVEVQGELILWWKNVKSRKESGTSLHIKIKIYCFCTKGHRHETNYLLLAVESPETHSLGGGDEVAPGVMICSRTTNSVAVWWLKLCIRLAKIPKIGKYVPDYS